MLSLFLQFVIILSIRMQLTQTPYEQLQRKDRQRKLSLLNSIEIKDLNRRTLSCNSKSKQNTSQPAPVQQKHEVKEHYSNITMSNSIKKSYYYRKLLNKSIDTHMTPEQFQRVKNKFDKINIKHISNENKSIFFREVWENQHEKKYRNRSDQERYIEPQQNLEKFRIIYLEDDCEAAKKTIINGKQKNIIEIAEERRSVLKNFDLEILGNKQTLKMKDNLKSDSKVTSTSHRICSKRSKQAMHYKTLKTAALDALKYSNKEEIIHPLFKRFQEENPETANQTKVQSPTSNKVSHSLFPITTSNQLINYKFKKLRLREFHSEMQPSLKRENESSERPTTTSPSKSNKPSTSEQKRNIFSDSRPSKKPCYINDINGWFVGLDNDEFFLSNYQN